MTRSNDIIDNRLLADYRGSVMAVVNDSTGFVETRNYYPYGLPHELPKVDKRAFEGKEMVTAARLHWLDYGPRRYDPATTFWTSPDPLSAARPDVSPYAYCAANPAANTDPSGMIIVYNYQGNDYICEEDEFGNYYFNHGSLGRLSDNYGDILTDAINKIGSKPIGKFYLNFLIYSNQNIYVKSSSLGKNYFDFNESTVYWRAKESKGALSYLNGAYVYTGAPFISLFHEFSHAIDKICGISDNSIWFQTKSTTVRNYEQTACFRENLLRSEHGFPRRDFYGAIHRGNEIEPISLSAIKNRPEDVIRFTISYNLSLVSTKKS